jgi:hypothetical protein
MNPQRFNLQSARVTLKEEIKDDFNFDESSTAWMLNKRRYGASYIYICGKPKCKNRVKGGGGVLCKYHTTKRIEPSGERILVVGVNSQSELMYSQVNRNKRS